MDNQKTIEMAEKIEENCRIQQAYIAKLASRVSVLDEMIQWGDALLDLAADNQRSIDDIFLMRKRFNEMLNILTVVEFH